MLLLACAMAVQLEIDDNCPYYYYYGQSSQYMNICYMMINNMNNEWFELSLSLFCMDCRNKSHSTSCSYLFRYIPRFMCVAASDDDDDDDSFNLMIHS